MSETMSEAETENAFLLPLSERGKKLAQAELLSIQGNAMYALLVELYAAVMVAFAAESAAERQVAAIQRASEPPEKLDPHNPLWEPYYMASLARIDAAEEVEKLRDALCLAQINGEETSAIQEKIKAKSKEYRNAILVETQKRQELISSPVTPSPVSETLPMLRKKQEALKLARTAADTAVATYQRAVDKSLLARFISNKPKRPH